MSLIQEAEDYATPISKYHMCRVGLAIAQHPEMADDIIELLDSDWSAPTISRLLAAHDIDAPISSVKNHRRKGCRCRS